MPNTNKVHSTNDVLPVGAISEETQQKMVAVTEIALAEEVVKSGGETESLNIDKFSIISSKPDILALPLTDPECTSVDAENGLWIKCSVCDSIINKKASPPRPSNVIPCRASRPFTLSRWIEHKATEMHQQRVGCLKRSGLEELASTGTINRFEKGVLNQLRKKQKTIQFLPKAPSSLVQATNATVKDTCDTTNYIAPRTCEGIIIAYRGNTSLQKKISAYVQYCAISSSTMYVAGKVLWNGLSQVFAHSCSSDKVTYQQRLKVFQCSKCYDLQ